MEPYGAHTAGTLVRVQPPPAYFVSRRTLKTNWTLIVKGGFVVSINYIHKGQITEWGKIKKRTHLINLKKDAEIAVQLRQAVVEGCQTY